MEHRPFYIKPGLFKANDSPILITTCSSSDTDVKILDAFLHNARGGPLGISASYNNQGAIKTLALATTSQVLRVHMEKLGKKQRRKAEKQQNICKVLQDKVLKNTEVDKVGFDMHRISTALYYDRRLFISAAIDVQSMHSETKPRHSDAVLLGALGGETMVKKDSVLRILRNDDDIGDEGVDVALRAWASWTISTSAEYVKRRPAVNIINTDMLPIEDLMVLSKCVRDTDRLFALKPTRVKNDVKTEFTMDKDGNIQLGLERYKTRIRSSSQRILVETSATAENDADPTHLIGRATRVQGKVATVKLNGRSVVGSIRAVHTIGREYTNAEQDRNRIVLAALHRTSTLLTQPLVRQIFCAATPQLLESDEPLYSSVKFRPPSIYYPVPAKRALNTSQCLAIRRILSEEPKDRVCLVQGPPGTGKTTVIAACVKSLMANPSYTVTRNVWLIAQSNVAVKNIAEKLADVDFFDFKLLVANEFHFEWHEHIYHKITNNVIVSDVFSDDKLATSRLLLGSRVILCTLSMLSHPLLMRSGVTRLVPVETVIVDEASQIEIGDYLSMLSKFGHGIRKIAFIGDDKQLAPYGADDVENLRSIFEVESLRGRAEFLAMQYRMPVPIGNFISHRIYDGRLITQHSIRDRNCCRLVDVSQGKELMSGGSFKNDGEAQAVVSIARKFVKEGKKFRVITPYDAQRAHLEHTLKREGLPWEDKCFCVDSFQGNEDEHIIISVVRSEKIGFLASPRRSNVMLTRCKKSMTICTSRAYLVGKAKDTLLGQLASELGESAWVTWRNVLAGSW